VYKTEVQVEIFRSHSTSRDLDLCTAVSGRTNQRKSHQRLLKVIRNQINTPRLRW